MAKKRELQEDEFGEYIGMTHSAPVIGFGEHSVDIRTLFDRLITVALFLLSIALVIVAISLASTQTIITPGEAQPTIQTINQTIQWPPQAIDRIIR